MENRRPLLSIITPVYNVEKYLGKCVSSIISQTFVDWELILIDDGSKDDSGLMCDDFEHKDSRIHVIHQVNAGASAARNAGLRLAQGEYITFVDSDDYIAPDTYLKNIQFLEKDHSIDVVVYPISRDDFIHEVDISNGRDKNDLKSIFDIWYRHYPMQSSLCNKIFRVEIIGSMRFSEGKVTGEDLAFASQLWDSIHHVYVSSEGGYYYNTANENSVTRNFDKKRMKEKLDEMTLLSSYIHNHSELGEYAVPFFVGKMLELFKVYLQHGYQMDCADNRILRSNRPSIKYIFGFPSKWSDKVYYFLFSLLGGCTCFAFYKKFHHR